MQIASLHCILFAMTVFVLLVITRKNDEVICSLKNGLLHPETSGFAMTLILRVVLKPSSIDWAIKSTTRNDKNEKLWRLDFFASFFINGKKNEEIVSLWEVIEIPAYAGMTVWFERLFHPETSGFAMTELSHRVKLWVTTWNIIPRLREYRDVVEYS